jgi:putative membrane protein
MNQMMWGYDGLGFLWMGLFWVGVVALAVWAVTRPAAVPNTGRRSPVEILEERFARGEVDADEFTARRNELAR